MAAIPANIFILTDPHPYVALGAPYGKTSPWMLRQRVLLALERAQISLQSRYPGWRVKIHDAYRPNAVQAFMVDREYGLQAKEAGLDLEKATPEQRAKLTQKVFRVWGIPSEDPATPPPHSTGAVVDITLVDAQGRGVDMGSALDENSDRSLPDYFSTAVDKSGRHAHKHREILKEIMVAEGFCRNISEWWHFSMQDQYWAWQERETGRNPGAVAIYGRADLV